MRSLARSTTAAVATSGALFALQHHTEAAVIYSGLRNVSLSVSHSIGTTWRLNLDPSHAVWNADVNLAIFRSTGRLHLALSGAGFIGNGSNALAKLGIGQPVSTHKAFSGGGLLKNAYGGHNEGTWLAGQIGFAGVKFSTFGSNSSSNTFYGWIRLGWTNMDNTQSLTAIDWAYNNTPGAPILTGQGIVTTPEPSRALLALAGFGSLALRRKRKQG